MMTARRQQFDRMTERLDPSLTHTHIRIMAFTDAVLAIICTSCAVPLWANGTQHFNPVRLVPFVTTFLLLSRLWEKQYVLPSTCRYGIPTAGPHLSTTHHTTPHHTAPQLPGLQPPHRSGRVARAGQHLVDRRPLPPPLRLRRPLRPHQHQRPHRLLRPVGRHPPPRRLHLLVALTRGALRLVRDWVGL